jgi:hypothetical protein
LKVGEDIGVLEKFVLEEVVKVSQREEGSNEFNNEENIVKKKKLMWRCIKIRVEHMKFIMG